MLDLRRLELLREVELRGSMAAAARALGVSSSAISQQLGKLEQEMGAQLLEQAGRNVRLTPLAQRLTRRVDEVVAMLSDAEAEVEQARHRVQGVVRFAGFSTFALRFLPDIVERVAASLPDVVLEFSQLEPTDAVDAVIGRRADIAVADEFPQIPRKADPTVSRTLLTRDDIEVYTPHPVASLADLADVCWAMEPVGSDARAWATRICREAGFEPVVRFESPDPRVHYELALTGLAAAFLPGMAFDSPALPHARPPHRVDAPLFAPDLHREVYAVTRRGGQTRPAVAGVVKVLAAVCADVAKT